MTTVISMLLKLPRRKHTDDGRVGQLEMFEVS